MPPLFLIGQRGGSILAIGAAALLGPARYFASAGQPQEQQSPPQQQGAQSQQSSPAQQSADAQPNSQPCLLEPRKKRVWTNEDFVALRTPADIYLLVPKSWPQRKQPPKLPTSPSKSKTPD